MRTNVYVDGFNLYYRRLKGTAYRWLDVRKMCELLLSRQLQDIHYFTARVKPRPSNPQVAQRQQAYLRALETVGVKIHYGTFQRRPRWAHLVNPPAGGPPKVEIWRTDEKGSDVNLATKLLVDGFQAKYDAAVVVSNDSDLRAPIEAVRSELGTPVSVLITDPRVKRSSLPADSHYWIRKGVLKASQFPTTVTDAIGTISRPPGW